MTCTVIATVCMYALCGLHMRKVFHTNKILYYNMQLAALFSNTGLIKNLYII